MSASKSCRMAWWCILIVSMAATGCQVDETALEELPPEALLMPEHSSQALEDKSGQVARLEPLEVDGQFREANKNKQGSVVPSNAAGGPVVQRVQAVTLSVQQSSAEIIFRAETGCCYEQHYWYLVNDSGQSWYLGYTGLFGNIIEFSMPNTIASGNYKVVLDAYIWNTIYGQWMYFDLESNPVYVPILATTPDVGVLAGSGGCPSSAPLARIFMDNEDNNPQSNVSGWTGATSVDGNRNTNFVFCRVSGYSFASLRSYSSSRTDYAVLQLGASCPPGSVPFGRYFDNEDNDNRNTWQGNISPNTTRYQGTWMRLCLFKGDGTIASALPSLGFEYGVLAGSSFGFTDATGTIYTDDQDSVFGNPNDNAYDVNSAWQSAAQAIVSSGENTTLRTARRASVSCGDNRCNGIETASSCRRDCGYCGDGVCYGSETVYNCGADCGYCGDGVCDSDEYYGNCPSDCSAGCMTGSTNEVGLSKIAPCP